MSLGIQFLTFPRITAPSPLWSSISRRLATWKDTVYYPGTEKEGSSWTKWMVDHSGWLICSGLGLGVLAEIFTAQGRG